MRPVFTALTTCGRPCVGSVCGLLVAWCLGSAPVVSRAADDEIVARVGTATIDRGSLDAVIRRLNPTAVATGDQRRQVEAAVLEQLVDELLLRAELERQLVAVADSEVDAGVERLRGQFAERGRTLEDFLAESGRDTATLRSQIALEIGLDKYVRQRMTPDAVNAEFTARRREVDGTRMRVSHLVLRPDIASPDGIERRLAQAKAIRRDILQGQMSFDEAARRYSAGPSRRRGGDLGWIGREAPMVDAFARPVFTLSKGDISKPFVTPFGVHVVKITDIEPGRLGLEVVRPKIEKLLAGRLVRELVAAARRATPAEYFAGVSHFDPRTPADGPQPRRVIEAPAAALP